MPYVSLSMPRQTSAVMNAGQGVRDDDQRAVELAAAHALVVEHHGEQQPEGEARRPPTAARTRTFQASTRSEVAQELGVGEHLAVVVEPDVGEEAGAQLRCRRRPRRSPSASWYTTPVGGVGDRVGVRRRTAASSVLSTAWPPEIVIAAPSVSPGIWYVAGSRVAGQRAHLVRGARRCSRPPTRRTCARSSSASAAGRRRRRARSARCRCRGTAAGLGVVEARSRRTCRRRPCSGVTS